MAFPDQGPLEFRECPPDDDHEVDQGRVFTGEDEVFLAELDANSPASEFPDDRAQVIKVAGQRVHAVNEHGVTVAGEPQQFFQLEPTCVLPC